MKSNTKRKRLLVDSVADRVEQLLVQMTMSEKIGQLSQLQGGSGVDQDILKEAIAAGQVSSLLNEVDLDTVNELQRVAVEKSRLGIPLLIARDVIHGFETVFPIPLGQAASFNPEVVKSGARVAALEAASKGINWTFAPMIDVSRDPRWGRIAESLGEDPYLTSVLGNAMIDGFQGDDLADAGSIAACAKHFAGYGASEAGIDYNTTNIPENELRNVHLRPFKAASEAGVATFMSSFGDLNGVPATASKFLHTQVLRDEWHYDGFVVSDWESISQLSIHGLTANDKESAYEAAAAGIDMEMTSTTYRDHLPDLIEDGLINESEIDGKVRAVLALKIKLGLFENPYTDSKDYEQISNPEYMQEAKSAALESLVLLKNENQSLPLSVSDKKSLAIIGPMADAPYEQLGTWIFDGEQKISQTPLQAIEHLITDDVDIHYLKAMDTTRSRDDGSISQAVELGKKSDVIILFLGEESILSGEAHSRADIDLPGNQVELIKAMSKLGKPVIAVILAGRPLTLSNIVDDVDALLYAWHPGTMGGPAIAEVLFGLESPSGKTPVTFPKVVGQIPIYYGKKNTGKPATDESCVHIDEIDAKAEQTSFGMTAFHLDAGYKPLFEFGYGLSYSEFNYSDLHVNTNSLTIGNSLRASVKLSNIGSCRATEIVQLYVRDLVGNVTRPVKELKGFKRITLDAGESTVVSFDIHTDDLAFYNREMKLVTEAGDFHLWIGGSSATELRTEFSVTKP